MLKSSPWVAPSGRAGTDNVCQMWQIMVDKKLTARPPIKRTLETLDRIPTRTVRSPRNWGGRGEGKELLYEGRDWGEVARGTMVQAHIFQDSPASRVIVRTIFFLKT